MKAITTNSFYAWILAARPKTLTGAVIPVLIGSSLAFADGKFDIIPALLCVLFACGMQIAANFINDLYDYLKGSDRADRLGPERACAQGWITPIAMKRGIAGTLIFSCLMGCALLQQCWGRLPHGGWELILLGLLCVIFAFLYTTILSYQGWGDLLVLVFFGLWFVYNDKIEPLAFIWAPCVYLYLHVLTWRKMAAIRSGKKLNSILGETSRNMLFFGLLLSLAFIQ